MDFAQWLSFPILGRNQKSVPKGGLAAEFRTNSQRNSEEEPLRHIERVVLPLNILQQHQRLSFPLENVRKLAESNVA